MFPTLFAQLDDQVNTNPDLGPMPAIFLSIQIVIAIVLIASYWKIFTKAGQPGWAAIIPIYNVIVYLQVVKRPVWWIILFLIPIVGFVVLVITLYDLAKVFGQGVGFFFGLLFLPFIFAPILAFGDSRYQGIVRAV